MKLPSVNMSASWVLVSTYLIWIWGSKLVLSNKQSRATLWVLETCLIVGLLPFMIILITASWSSKIYNIASLREECTFDKIKSTLSKSLVTLWDYLRLWIVWGQTTGLPVLSWFWVVFPRTETIRSPWLLCRYRAGSRHEQTCTASQYCHTLHWSGWCLDYFSSWVSVPRPSGLTPWNTGCPEFSKCSTICDARRSHLPPYLAAYPWYHLLSSPGPKNAQCPSLNVEAYSLIFLEVRAQESSLSFPSSSMSLNIDMKIIRSLIFSSVMFFPCRSAWILWRCPTL